MTLPKKHLIEIPLNHKDPNGGSSLFHRLLESNKTVRNRTTVKTRTQSNAKQKQKRKSCTQNETWAPSSSTAPQETCRIAAKSHQTPSTVETSADLTKHFEQLEEQKRLRMSYQHKNLLTELRAKSRRTLNEPRLHLALQGGFNNNYRGRELFIHTDTPIFKLPTECMMNIFTRCSSFEDYCQIMVVCKKWRNLISSVDLWKDISIDWSHFKKIITLKSSMTNSGHIRSLRIYGSNKQEALLQSSKQISMKPFQHLRHIYMSFMNITDIKTIAHWMKNLESLHCENTYCTYNQGVSLRLFFDMQNLKSFKVSFVESYNVLPVYDFGGRVNKPFKRTIPAKLETLSLEDVYDREEHLIDPNYTSAIERFPDVGGESVELDSIITSWSILEEQLVQKYSVLASLTNLKSLTLGRVSSFTSRVWQECLKPCASQLEYLAMKRWPGPGKRESPQTLINRRRQASNTAPAAGGSERIIDGVEAAIAEYISCLTNIKEIHLDDFVCGIGLIDGIDKLNKAYHVKVEGLENEKFLMSDFKAIKLFDFKIKMDSEESREPATL